jgi:hypothetical protein
MTRRTVLLALPLLAFSGGGVVAAPRAELWTKWLTHDPDSRKAIDHAPWARFLKRHVRVGEDRINRVAYASVSTDDKARLDRYIAALASIRIRTYRRNEQFAYWVNLYNALTVQVVLGHYPITTIREIRISPGWLSVGPWGRKLIVVEEEGLSLDDIEHRILRPIWKDPRIHYAVNCAAVGCPNLQPLPFTPDNADKLLERAAREYVNHPRGVQVRGGGLHLSRIYDWYRTDFGGTDDGVIAHLKRHANPLLAHALDTVSQIEGYDYDWSLNEAKAVSPSATPVR